MSTAQNSNSINDETVAAFKSDVITACPSLVTLKDQYVARSIPNSIFEKMFREIFEGDSLLARDILFGRVERLRNSSAHKEIEKIETLDRASSILASSAKKDVPILLISDNDNDGAISQAIAMEGRRLMSLNINVQGKDYNPENHGFSIEQISAWLSDSMLSHEDEFTVMVVDLGTNQREEQNLFLKTFPKASLIIADHHKPALDQMVSVDAVRSVLVSPFTKGSVDLAMRGGGGVSGGYLLYTIMKNAAKKLQAENLLIGLDIDTETRPMEELARAANLLDMVKCDLRLKPLHESDIKKALDISSLTNNGRAVSRWISESQVDHINALKPLIGEDSVNAFLTIRQEILEQNHIAKALLEALPLVISPQEEQPTIYEFTTLSISSQTAESSADSNYVEKIRPYLFNFSYESRYQGDGKSQWLNIAERCLKDVGSLDQKIRVLLREHNLVKQISNSFAIVTQASSPIVEQAFSAKQLDNAYQSLDKTIKLSVVATRGNQIVLSSRSNVSMHELVQMSTNEIKGAELIYRGHGGAGALTVRKSNAGFDRNFEDTLKEVIQVFGENAKILLEREDVTNAMYVEPIHLPLVKEIFQKTRAHLTPGSMPDFLLKASDDTTFEDTYTLEKRPVHDIIRDNEWITTVEPLSFDGSKKLLLPNQALKSLAEDEFKGALSLRLLTNGAFMASKVYTGAQLAQKDIPKMTLPIEKERVQLSSFYKKHFKGRDYPAITVSREDAIKAIKFAADPEKVFKNFEATVVGLLAQTSRDSYVVLDVEADGAGDAQCINVGLAIYRKDPSSGTSMSVAEFGDLIAERPEQIDNYRYIDDNHVLVNERITIEVASQLAATDEGQPIRVSLKVQNLTNLTMDMLAELGASNREVQRNILNVLAGKGKLIFQAHNLPYDNNISRVNYPELYDLMSNSLHIDSAVPAKNYQIAYTGIKVNNISGVEFYNAEFPGYNLSTLIGDRSLKSFSYPSIKGSHILNVNGEDVVLFDKDTRISTKLSMTRSELQETLLPTLKPMQYPKYGIEKLLRMATIRDMIDHQPVKETVYIPYQRIGNAAMDDSLWQHFQTHYAFEKTLDENIIAFKMLPEVKNMLDGIVSNLDTAPEKLVAARAAGNDNFSPNKKFKTKKAEAEHAKALSTFTYEDVFKMNAIDFLEKNQSNAERYARSWLYELVLEQHETTEKNPQASFISGISELTGIQNDMIKTIYDEVYRYRKFRDIQSYRVHETHNNIGLEGDAFQESIAFIHMLALKRNNPFLVGEIALRNQMNGNSRVIEDLYRQAASSSLKQIIRQITKVAMDSDRFNTYSAKQMNHFSDDGISAKHDRGNTAIMRCRTLSESDKTVMIELPEFNPNTFRNLSKEEKQALEERMEMAVTILILANSRKNLPESMKTIVENLVTSSENLEFLKSIKKEFGSAFATEKEDHIKKMLAACCDAILGNDVLKLPSNREIPVEDLEMCESALIEAIGRLRAEQGFESYVSEQDIKDAIHNAKGQYLANQEAFKNMENVTSFGSYPPLDQYAKAAQTKRITLLSNILSDHEDAFPELARTALGIKKDPIQFLMESPLLKQLIKHDTQLDMKNDLQRVKGLKYS